MQKLQAFLNDADGASAIEYALLASFIALAIVAGMTTIGIKVSTTFTNTQAGF